MQPLSGTWSCTGIFNGRHLRENIEGFFKRCGQEKNKEEWLFMKKHTCRIQQHNAARTISMINTQKKAPAEPPKPSMNQGINSTNRVTSFFLLWGVPLRPGSIASAWSDDSTRIPAGIILPGSSGSPVHNSSCTLLNTGEIGKKTQIIFAKRPCTATECGLDLLI
jgi:hypothetical protein